MIIYIQEVVYRRYYGERLDYEKDDRKIEVQFSSGQEIFLSPKISREVLKFTQPQIQ
jgi:hypothetical protein